MLLIKISGYSELSAAECFNHYFFITILRSDILNIVDQFTTDALAHEHYDGKETDPSKLVMLEAACDS